MAEYLPRMVMATLLLLVGALLLPFPTLVWPFAITLVSILVLYGIFQLMIRNSGHFVDYPTVYLLNKKKAL